MKEALSIQGLSKKFGKKVVLHDIHFTLEQGKIVGLVGPNGAGKTTIMKALLGLIDYEEGSIFIEGQNLSQASHRALDKVGALIEYPGIYPYLTGYDHLKLFSETGNKETIEELVTNLKMNEYIHKKAKSYSLGMKQKLGIALALVNQPEIIILDEPMNGLDPQAMRDVRELILNLSRKGKTFLISSHVLSELEKIANEVIILNHGNIIQITSMKDLLLTSKQYVLLSTSDDTSARQLATQAGFKVESSEGVKIVKENEEQLGQIIAFLSANNIQIKDVKHIDSDLETSFLEVLHATKDGENK